MSGTKITLRSAIRLACTPGTDLHRALNQLVGCPEGGWAETAQAMAAIRDELPLKSERDWTRGQLIDAVMVVGFADRWTWRDEVRT